MGAKGLLVAVAVAAFGVWTAPASASFPGRDGDLVVQTDTGLELVNPATGAASSICTDAGLCGHPTQPHFSPNGGAIAFVDQTTHRPVVVASDGSCLWCLSGKRLTTLTGSEPAFVPGGRAVTISRNGLWNVSLTGGKKRRLVKGVVGDAVWSAGGLVAFVRGGWVWVGPPGGGKPRRLARGSSPSWSPDGRRLAVARGGYVWVVRAAGGSGRRLVAGGAPAWSPDGRQIAYIGSGGAVEIIGVGGGASRQVGSVQGTALDWQPLPNSTSEPCTPPAGSTVLASSSAAIVYSLGGDAFNGPRVYGCLEALGRAQLLRSDVAYFARFVAVTLAGRFVAVEAESAKAPGVAYYATMYDLSSGAPTQLASADYLAGPPIGGLDSLAVDSSGFAAWRETTPLQFPEQISGVACASPSLCIAGDQAGDILSSTNPAGGKSAWSMTSISPTAGPFVTHITCPSTSLCLGVGSALNYTDPSGGTSAWARSDIDPQNTLDALSCPSVSLCVGTDDGGVLTSTDPTGGPGDWTRTPIGGQSTFVDAISCPSVSLCVGTEAPGYILSSTDPTGGASAWKQKPIDQGNLGAISCPSVSLCVVAGPQGSILTSTDPTGGASAWTATPIAQLGYISAISCPSVSLCVAVDWKGNVLTSTNPAGGVGAWSKASIDQGRSLNAISCPSISLCVAGDQNGNILTSTDPTGGTNAWTIAAVDTPPCASQCTDDQLYVRDDHGTRAVDSAPVGNGNLIANVTLGGDSLTLNWTDGGAQRQLQLG